MGTFSALQIIALCFTAFGLGYSGGSLQRLGRRAIESLD